jgi:peptidylprolyl isomerase
VERLDQAPRGLVIARLDRVEHLVDELGPKPVFIVDMMRIASGFGRGLLALAHDRLPRLDRNGALLWAGPLWRKQRRIPKCPTRNPLIEGQSMADADRLTLSLSSGGDVVIKLRPDLAPGHVERITELANDGFYDGVTFHRVIPGFMAQGGDPTGTGMGGSDKPNLKAEFSQEPHVRGTCSMARSSNPDSANSQFFICFDDARFLDGQYTVWGEVESGMEHVDALPKGEPPASPGKIVKASVA